MDPEREVVITGLGVVSPIGIGLDDFWTSVREARSGVAPIAAYENSDMPVAMGGELRGFDAKQYVKPRKALKVMNRELQTAFSAAALATEHAGLTPGQVAPERIGTVFGGEMLYGDVAELIDVFLASSEQGEFSFAKYGAQFASLMNPLWMLKNLPNMPACHVGIALDAQGPNNTIVAGDASGLLALIEGTRVIQRGTADLVVVGGSGTRIGLTGWMYRGDLKLSHRTEDPASASRPFDAARDGMVNGEGAAAVVLESRASATQRGVPVLARVAGCGITMATVLDVAGRRDALARAIRSCLSEAAMQPAQVGHVNANGLSTVEGDEAEAAAIREELNDVPVTAPKSLFGNTGAAGPLLELVASVLALQHQLIPPTRNYETPDPACPVRVVAREPVPHEGPGLVKLSYSARGQTAAVALGREDS